MSRRPVPRFSLARVVTRAELEAYHRTLDRHDIHFSTTTPRRCSICGRKRTLTFHGTFVHLCRQCEASVSGVFCR